MRDSPRRKHLARIPILLPLDSPVVYFVTACCHGRQRVFIADGTVRVATMCLRGCEERHGWVVSQICFMPDHVHLLIAPMWEREQSIADFMRAWKSCVTLRLHSGKIWQNEFFDHLLRCDESAQQKWNYVRMNPVRAGLCANAEDYRWSGTTEEILRRLDGID